MITAHLCGQTDLFSNTEYRYVSRVIFHLGMVNRTSEQLAEIKMFMSTQIKPASNRYALLLYCTPSTIASGGLPGIYKTASLFFFFSILL